MTMHRVYTDLEALVGLRLAASQLSLKFDSHRLQQVHGEHLSRFKGQGIDFAEHRQYQPGDDPRTIDWRVTARRGRPHTRVYHEDIERPILILCDQSINMFFGSQHAFKSVRAAEIAALLCWAGLQQGDRVGGIVFSDRQQQAIKPSRHHKQALRMLDGINSYNQSLQLPQRDPASVSLNDALLELRRIARPGSHCYLISDWRQFDHTSTQLLFELNRHCQLLVFQIFDPLETHLPPGQFKLSNGDDELHVDTANQGLESRFEDAYKTWQRDLNQQLAQTGIGAATISTWDDPLAKLCSLQVGGPVYPGTASTAPLSAAADNPAYPSHKDQLDGKSHQTTSATLNSQQGGIPLGGQPR